MDQPGPKLTFLKAGGIRLAVRRRDGRSPTILFLPGYLSDMEGAKAQAIDAFAADRGQACVRFDYSGTGSSEGEFEKGTLGRWLEDSLKVVDEATEGPLVLVGSSMGGWLSLHIALQRPEQVQAIVGVAAAPDFTDWGFNEAERERLHSTEIDEQENNESTERFFTRRFWESGQDMLLLNEAIHVDCPVRLIHGADDMDVPVEVAHRTMRQLRSADVQLTIVKGGGHRLSAPHEIDAILQAIARLLEPQA